MSPARIAIRTRDGHCPAHLVTPIGEGRWPAVLFYGDAGGIRPAMVDMAQRLADAGYVVLLPDLFYRFGPYGPLVPEEVFKGDVMAVLGPLMATTGNDKAAADTEAFLAYLEGCDAVVDGKVGAVGFCMGGGMAIAAAGRFPDRFAAVASFHGGNLATDASTSPHLLAPRIESEVYVAVADDDGSCPPAMVERLEQAFRGAGVNHRTEIYAGAVHGWMVPDFPVFDAVSAQRGWDSMLALFARTLAPD
ncbi:MAG: dienelactone hydrolase family protein [Janthinobacterium lividum]